MSSNQTLTTPRANDTVFSFQLLLNERPMNLTGFTLEFHLKPSAQADDATGITLNSSTGVTVTNATRGTVDILVPATANTTAGNQWWRLDAIDTAHNNARITVMYGPYVVLAV